jgi:hypothetical protein
VGGRRIRHEGVFETHLQAAEVLVYVDRPAITHYWSVTKRLLTSPFRKPLGWPEDSPVITSTMTSYQVLRRSSRFWAPVFRARLLSLQPGKQVHIICCRSNADAMLGALSELLTEGRA